ncbi:hypothetical protein ABZ442_05140 [Streptomyces triculaminicus]|uniref:hypothetical protein n=1 Tax=Streptomyces triculaminicus TaxID=2816232 RepID=UPI0033D4124E
MTFPDTPLVLSLLFAGLLAWLAGLLLLLIVAARVVWWVGCWMAGLRHRPAGRHRYWPATAVMGTAEQDEAAIAAHDTADGAQ